MAHLIDSQLTGTAETILDAAQYTIHIVLVSLKLQHCVHDVFQHLGTSQGAFLVDMSYEQDAGPSALGILEQTGCTLAYLSQTARAAVHRLSLYGLYGIYDHQGGLCLFYLHEYLLQGSLCEHQQVTTTAFPLLGGTGGHQAVGTQFQLACTLLTAHIQHTASLQSQDGLQYQGTLAYARLSPQQHQTARNKSSTQYTVQFTVTHIHTRLFIGMNLCHRNRLCLLHTCPTSCFECRLHSPRWCLLFPESHLLHSIPLLAGRASAHPPETLLSAIVTHINLLLLGHN